MIGQSSVFTFGHLYITEIQRLIDEQSIDPAEAAALIAQSDTLSELSGRIVCQQHRHYDVLVLMAKLADHSRIEAMLKGGMSPMLVSRVRARRFRIYCQMWHSARCAFLADSTALGVQFADACEWPAHLREYARRARARYLFAALYLSGLRYRAGLNADIDDLVMRLGALALGMPDHHNCTS